MADVVDKDTRSRMMANINSRNTKPELYIRRKLHGDGYRFRINQKKIKGTPDIVLKKYSALIFINGCFWHGHDCRYFRLPETRREFWTKKIEGNRIRDSKNADVLLKDGWRICIVWECATRSKKKDDYVTQIENWIKSKENYKEIRD